MTEPEYVYIKGQGWVIQTHPSVTIQLDTRVIRLTNRTPRSGEKFFNNFASAEPGKYTPEYILEDMVRSMKFFEGRASIGVDWDQYSREDYPQTKSPYNVVIEIL